MKERFRLKYAKPFLLFINRPCVFGNTQKYGSFNKCESVLNNYVFPWRIVKDLHQEGKLVIDGGSIIKDGKLQFDCLV
jgi:hypothetical protein